MFETSGEIAVRFLDNVVADMYGRSNLDDFYLVLGILGNHTGVGNLTPTLVNTTYDIHGSISKAPKNQKLILRASYSGPKFEGNENQSPEEQFFNYINAGTKIKFTGVSRPAPDMSRGYYSFKDGKRLMVEFYDKIMTNRAKEPILQTE